MKYCFLAIAVLFVAFPGTKTHSQATSDSSAVITPAESMEAAARVSKRRELPIVVFVSQHGCQYCKALREDVLYPMIRAGQADQQMILREVSLDAEFELLDFAGVVVAGKDFAGRYGATITPTLLFLDAKGAEIAERRVGTGNIEFYAHYFERSLATATLRIHERSNQD
jgi:thioredoxin-related protein